MELSAPVGDHEFQFEVSVHAGRFSDLQSFIVGKEDALKREKHAIKEWYKLDEFQRDALQDLVAQALYVARENVDQWLPGSVSIEPGSFVDVSLRIVFSDIDAAFAERERAEALLAAESAKRLSSLVSELEESNGERQS